jgi:hypothetical protein
VNGNRLLHAVVVFCHQGSSLHGAMLVQNCMRWIECCVAGTICGRLPLWSCSSHHAYSWTASLGTKRPAIVNDLSSRSLLLLRESSIQASLLFLLLLMLQFRTQPMARSKVQSMRQPCAHKARRAPDLSAEDRTTWQMHRKPFIYTSSTKRPKTLWKTTQQSLESR